MTAASEYFAVSISAFRGEDEYVSATTCLAEVTEAYADGAVEIAFDAPLPGKPRLYITVRISDLTDSALAMKGAKE